MSHFTVTVRLTAERLARHGGDYNAALNEIMAPYQENNMGDCPRQFMEFNDEEDENRKEYEEETDTWIDLGPVNDVSVSGEVAMEADSVVSGTERIFRGRRLVRSWHDMFRVPGSLGIGGGSHHVPDRYAEVEIPYKELHSTFEDFMRDYHGSRGRDPEKNRYGYWHNPNQKWDWWVIGGRWRGHFPTKPGVIQIVGEPGAFDNPPDAGADVARVNQIDFDVVAKQETEAFEKFKAEYRRLLKGEKFKAFDGPRSRALDIGLLRVEQDPAAPLRSGEIQLGGLWGEEHPNLASENQPGGRAFWRDIALDPSDVQFERYRCTFNPLTSYAALDDAGWHEPGEMGWFGMASHTPDTYLAYSDSFLQNVIKATGPDDLLVLLDCHT